MATPPGNYTINEVDKILRSPENLQSIPRRSYHSSGFYPPLSFWQRSKASIVVGGVVGLCCTGFAANWWAEQRAQNFHDYSASTFIRENFVCSQENFEAGRWWVGLTSSVMHFNAIHLGVNMLSLSGIGQSVVMILGVPTFSGIYIISQVCCTTASLAWRRRQDEIRKQRSGWRWDKKGREQQQKKRWFAPREGTDTGIKYGGSIGASGAIMGLVGAWTLYAPRSTMWFFFIPAPAWLSTGALAASSLYFLDNGILPQIGHAGHVGGLVGGMVSYLACVRYVRFARGILR